MRETERFKRALVTKALAKHGGNRTHAARELEIGVDHLRLLIRRWGLK